MELYNPEKTCQIILIDIPDCFEVHNDYLKVTITIDSTFPLVYLAKRRSLAMSAFCMRLSMVLSPFIFGGK